MSKETLALIIVAVLLVLFKPYLHGLFTGIYKSIIITAVTVKKIVYDSVAQNLNADREFQIYAHEYISHSKFARYNYFLGPCYAQIRAIGKSAYRAFSKYFDLLENEKNSRLSGFLYRAGIATSINTCIAPLAVLVLLPVIIFETAFLAVNTCILIICTILTLTILLIARITDSTCNYIFPLHNYCPKCFRKFEAQNYCCPNCKEEHKYLSPNIYGIFTHRCSCGYRMRTSYMWGKQYYKVKCTFCSSFCNPTGRKKYFVHLVGTEGSGKTALLAHILDVFLMSGCSLNNYTYAVKPKKSEKLINDIVKTGNVVPTSGANPKMIFLNRKLINQEQKTEIKSSICFIDAPGSYFLNNSDEKISQYEYCDAYILTVSITEGPDKTSKMLGSFISTLGYTRNNIDKAIQKPAVIVLTKCDEPAEDMELNNLIQRQKRCSYTRKKGTAAEFEINQQEMNKKCHNYLRKHGFVNAVNLIDSNFTDVTYFVTSTQIHNERNDGIEEIYQWLKSRSGIDAV
jgi:Ni2+-binding GTPase involved in maturation of urease and hydrogenase